MNLIYNPKFTAKQIVDQVQEEIAKLQNTPMDPKELERVKTQVRAITVKGMQDSLSRARTLAQYAITDGDPGLINTEGRVVAVNNIRYLQENHIARDLAEFVSGKVVIANHLQCFALEGHHI